MTVIISIVFLMVILFLIERSYRIYRLKKTIAGQDAELLDHKNKKEAFAMSIKQSQEGNSLVDPLTNLLSKEAFDNQYTHLLSQSKRFNNLFAILMIDINQFKRINEKYSRAIGDSLLIEMGKRLKNTLRDVDIMSRYQGNVFIALLPNMIKSEVVVHAVERIMQSLSVPFETQGKSIEVSLCVGIAIYPFDGDDKDALLAHAKEALKKAKSNGKNVFQFYQEETQILGKRELNLKTAIKDADFLRNVTLEFKPYYNTPKNIIECIEVIASLNHPELGKISFVELARIPRYTSKMFELYEWMIKSSVEQCAKANNKAFQKYPLIFKFNLKQFETPHFAEKIMDIVSKVDRNNNQIVLELTDDADNAGVNLEIYRESITKFNDANLSLVIGVLALGHFALNKLNHVHFNYLKVDEKLVHDLGKREESKIILERILSLVENLKVAILITGVDTEEQKKALEAMGCSVMQGKVFKENITP